MHLPKKTHKNKAVLTPDKLIFQSMFEGHSAVMLLVEPEAGNILDANQSAVIFYGYSKLKLCSMLISEINTLPPEQVAAERQKAFNEKRNYFVFPHRLASGEVRIVEVHSSPIALHEKQVLFSIIHDITERKRAEQALQVSEQFMNAAINALSAHVCILDESGTILNVNQAWRNFAKSNSSSDNGLVEGANYLNVCDAATGPDAEIAHSFAEGIRKVMRNECDEFSMEYPCHSPDIQRWFIGKVTRFSEQVPIRVAVAHENITELKLAEEALRESKISLQAVMQSTADGVLAVTSENRVLFSNERFAEMWKIPSTVIANEEDTVLLQLILDQLINPQGFLQKVQELYNSDKEDLDTLYFVDGREFERLSHPLIREGILCGRVWSFRDITRRKQADEALRRSEQRFHAISDTAGDLIFTINPDGTINYVNELAAKAFNVAPQLLVGQHLRDVFPPEIFEQHWRDLQKVFDTGQPLYKETTSHFPHGVVWQAIWLTPMRNDSGQIIAVIGDARDITERKRVEDELRASEEKFRAFIDQSTDGISLINEQGLIVEWNHQQELGTGILRSQALGRPIWELMPMPAEADAASRDRLANGLAQLQKNIQDADLDMLIGMDEIPYRLPDGSVRQVEHRYFPVSTGTHIYWANVSHDITERKQMEQVLRESEEKYRTVANFTYDWEAWRSTDGSYLYVSPSCEHVSGHSAAEFLADPQLIVNIAHPDDMAIVNEHFDAAIHHSKEQDHKLDFRILMPNGEIRWISHHCTAVYGESGQWLGRRESNRDISERKQAELALWESQSLYHSLVEDSPLSICRKDLNGCFTFANRRFLELSQTTLSDLVCKNDFDLHPLELAEKYRRDDQSVIDNGQVLELIEERAILGGGAVIMQSIKTPVYDGNGKINGTQISFWDITERKRAEEALRESEKKFRALAENIPNVIYQCRNDSRYTFLYINSAVEKLTGYPPQAFLKDGLSFFDLYHPDDVPEIKAPFTPKPAINCGAFHITYRIRHRSGGWRWVDEWGIGVLDEQGEVEYIEGVLIDITERKQAEESITALLLRNQTLLQTASDGIHILDDQGYVEETNAAFCAMLGYTREELLQLNIADWDAQWSGEELLGKVREIIAHPAIFETRHRRKDGTLFDVEINGIGITLEGRNYLYASVRDITERKRAEEAQRWNQLLLQLMASSSPLGFLVVDNRTDDILYFNQRFCEIWGIQHLAERMKRGELKNNDIIPDCLPVLVDIPAFAKSCKPLQEETNRAVVEDEIAFIEGRTIRRFSTQIRTDLDEYYGRFYIFEDITERKQVEEKLQESEKRFRNLVETTSDWIWEIDNNRVYTYSSPHIRDILGYEPSEIIGKRPEDFMPPEEAQRVLGIFSPIFAAHSQILNLENKNLHKDGRVVILETSGIPIVDNNGVFCGYRGIDRDITERKQAEIELRFAKETLEIAHQALEYSFEREKHLSHIDELTGVNNRRSLYELIEREFNVAMRYRPPLSVLMFDIDDFKHINDTFGHAIGDQVLERVVQTVCAKLRSADVIGRYGGDEFVVLLPQTSKQEALPLAERIHASIATIQMHTDKGSFNVTISIGIAQTIHNNIPNLLQEKPAQPDTVENLFLRADQALYAAKQAGRNRTVVFD